MQGLFNRAALFFFDLFLTRQMKTGTDFLFRCQGIKNPDCILVRRPDKFDSQFSQLRFKVLVRFHPTTHTCPCHDNLWCGFNKVFKIIHDQLVTPFPPPWCQYLTVWKDNEDVFSLITRIPNEQLSILIVSIRISFMNIEIPVMILEIPVNFN